MQGRLYLKEGSGDPCAGHVNANVCNAFSWYAARFDLEENFGSALPMGSKILIHSVENSKIDYKKFAMLG